MAFKPKLRSPASSVSEDISGKLDCRALIDLVCIVLVLVLVKQLLLPHSYLLAGPASTLTAIIVGTWLLKRRRTSWADLGLRTPESLIKTLALSILVFATIVIVSAMTNWLTSPFFPDVGTSGRFDFVEGNLPAYLFMLLLVWTHGSIFEELLFRAFIISRASAVFGGTLKSDIAAAVMSSVFFGYRHYYYQGMKGAIITGAIGLAMALLYLWFGRKNIWPLILSHGAINTLGQTTRFLGVNDD